MSMINCPKCNFFQPKDQYCANCGVNMETWTPPKEPLWKKIISNWMFQISLLFIIIFIVILRDNFTEREQQKILTRVPQIKRKSINHPSKTNLDDSQNLKKELRAKSEKLVESSVQAVKAQPLGSIKEAKKILNDSQTLKKRINARIYFIPKNNIASILNSSNRLEDNAGTLHSQSFENYRKKKKDWTSLDSTSTSFNFNEPQILFIGENSTDLGKGFGFYFQITVFEASENGSIHFEIKASNDLKTNTESTEYLTLEVSMKRTHALILSQLALKNTNYNEEEISIFESNKTLRVLNSSRFIEDFNDLLLVLEIQ